MTTEPGYKCYDHLGNEYPSKKQMCNKWNISINIYDHRRKNGLSIKEALTNDKNINYCDHMGKEFSSETAMCEYYNITLAGYKSRCKKGLTIEEALQDYSVTGYKRLRIAYKIHGEPVELYCKCPKCGNEYIGTLEDARNHVCVERDNSKRNDL